MDWGDDREVDSDIVTWFKEKLHKLDGYEDFMWIEKDHMPVLADFVFSLGSKTMYCYMTKIQGQAAMLATYMITRIPKCAQILYLVRDQGFMTPESINYMVSIGSVRNTSGGSLARSMSDLQTMVKRRQLMKPQVAGSSSFQKPKKPPPMKKNALMPSLSDERMPSRVGTRLSTPMPLFTDTVRSRMRLMTPEPKKPQTPEEPMHPMLRMVAASNAAKALAMKHKGRPQTRG